MRGEEACNCGWLTTKIRMTVTESTLEMERRSWNLRCVVGVFVARDEKVEEMKRPRPYVELDPMSLAP